MALHKDTIRQAIRHLRRRDRILATVIDRVGPFRLTLQRNRFASLARAIVAQQISGAAARTIWSRLEQQLAPAVSAEGICRLSSDTLRSVGLSRQKADYLQDLAQRTASGQIHFARFGRMSDEDIVQELTAVRGVGRWTAQMFLIFSLGRMDVFAPDDLGLRSAIRTLYGLAELPNKSVCLEYAQPWSPFSSVASWYLWRSLD